MGATHFQTRRLGNVATEMSLYVLAYNLKRAIAILGTGPLVTACEREPERLVARSPLGATQRFSHSLHPVLT